MWDSCAAADLKLFALHGAYPVKAHHQGRGTQLYSAWQTSARGKSVNAGVARVADAATCGCGALECTSAMVAILLITGLHTAGSTSVGRENPLETVDTP